MICPLLWEKDTGLEVITEQLKWTKNSTAQEEIKCDIRSHHGNSQATDSGVFSYGEVLEWGITVKLFFLEGLSWGRKILGACCLENAFNEG